MTLIMIVIKTIVEKVKYKQTIVEIKILMVYK